MNKRLVVGLTGGIGTGKSTAVKQFHRRGAATICLDEIVHEQAKPGRAGYKAIVKAFGPCILNADKTVNRALLGRVIFSDKRAKSRLERELHPLVLKEMRARIGKKKGLVIVDVPLLFEKNLQKNFDATIAISCKPRTQLRRIMRRDGYTAAEARRRMKAQMPLARKERLADVTIRNDRTISHLKTDINAYHEGLSLLLGGLTHGNAD